MSCLLLQIGIQSQLGAFGVLKKELLQAVKYSRLCPWYLWWDDVVDLGSSRDSKLKLTWELSCLQQGRP